MISLEARDIRATPTTTTERRRPTPSFALLPAAAVTLLAIYVGVMPALSAPATGRMAVVFSPWVTTETVIAAIVRAGGDVAGPTRLSSVVVAVSNDTGFQPRMRAEGAILFLTTTNILCGALGVPYPEDN